MGACSAAARTGPCFSSSGRARVQPVQVGQRNDREGQILNGLSEGQTVVLHPPDTLTDGARVGVRGK